ncbi:MAG: Mur ligase family protein, partial [Aggregatilineales bacterium]
MISLYDLLRAATGQLFGEPGAQIFADFCLDPHQAGESLMYVTRHTEQGDTHHYIEEAIRNGVSGVLCTRPPDCDTDGVTVIMVPDTVDALLQWAHFTLGKLGVKTIGIAGSSSKSVTVAAVSAVLEMRHRVHVSNEDVPGRLSLALSLSTLSPEHEFAVFKLDTTHPGEMAQMVQTIQPEIAVITGIDCVHPASFDSCEQYIAELTVLAEYLSPGALLALNYDDDNALNLATKAHEQVQTRTAGIDRFGSDVLAFNINHGLGRTGFDIRYGNERYLGRWTPIAGKDHLYGMLLA